MKKKFIPTYNTKIHSAIRVFNIFSVLAVVVALTVCSSLIKEAESQTLVGLTSSSEYQKGNLSIISDSDYWSGSRLRKVFDELCLNFIGDEFRFLSQIRLYKGFRNQKTTILGNYYEDISFDKSGKLVVGGNAYIELYDVDRYKTTAEMAHALAHEYGHHYTIVNICRYEGLYYDQWRNSEYGLVRKLYEYPIEYQNSSYLWSPTEIAANDYVQLLASPNARLSYDYKDIEEMLNEYLDGLVQSFESDLPKTGESIKLKVPMRFNSKPQDNMFLPLATDLKGLHQYLTKISGKNHKHKDEVVTREINSNRLSVEVIKESTYFDESSKYTLMIDMDFGLEGEHFNEYTLVMYPCNQNNLSTGDIKAVKTFQKDEPKFAVLGSVFGSDSEGNILGFSESYEGNYGFKVLAKDENGFVYASQPYYVDFEVLY